MYIVTIKEHRHLGYLLALYTAENTTDNQFIEVKEAVVASDIKKYPDRYSDTQKKLATLIDSYSDANIAKTYGGKKMANPQTFFANYDTKNIEQYIRPTIDKQIIKILDICRNQNIGIYFKDPKQKRIIAYDKVDFVSQNAQAVFNFERTETETHYYLTAKYKDRTIKLLGKNICVLSYQPCVCIIDYKILYFDNIDAKKLIPFTTREYIPVLRRVEPQYYEKFIKTTIAEGYTINAKGFEIINEDITPHPILSVERDFTGFIIFVLKFKYGKTEFTMSSKHHIVVQFFNNNQQYYFTKLVRDIEYEQEIENAVYQIFEYRVTPGTFRIRTNSNEPYIQEAFAIQCLNTNKEKLVQLGVDIEQNIFKKNYYTGKLTLDMRINNRTDWFDIYAIVKLENFEIPFISLRYYILNYIREFTLPDGSIVILPEEWFERYHDIFATGIINKTNNTLSLHQYQYAALSQLPPDVFSHITIEKLQEQLTNFDKQPMNIPQNVKATLRPYQIVAYNWLKMMRDFHFGACLADDMGLGKTLCTLAILANSTMWDDNNCTSELFAIEEKIPSLLLVPKSLIYNWINEVHKFVPHIKILEYSGNDRTKLIKSFKYYDIVISGYSIMRNDIDLFEPLQFNYIVLDESQTIKNSASKTYTALMRLNCYHRLTLTGTPLENSLTDLWSQINFINPELLGSLALFKKQFVTPIEKANNSDAADKLKKLIYPFILRRTKQQVLNDLPEKIEQVVYCEMSETQKEVYEREKSRTRNAILNIVEQGMLDQSAVFVLQSLTKLRQIACSPLLIDSDYKDTSGKTEEILLAIQNVVAQKHKVLIFSSFVKHLELIAQQLRTIDIDYAMLTGDTEHREKEVEKFTNEVPIFLISIKAGGTGLNLTQADYVFIIDPWWNPAVEEQAIARAHRIGQKNSVMVYRFIAKNSVEEKIQIRQQKKAGLAATFVNEQSLFNPAIKDDVLEILE